MSHFVVYALVSPEDEDPKGTLDRLLEPYNENREDIDPYDEECSCVGHKKFLAWSDNPELGGDAMEKIRGRYEEYKEVAESRVLYWKENKTPEEKARSRFFEVFLPDLWDELTADLFAKRKAVEDTVSGPIEDCEECHGTGVVKSTYNPKSKWDWWRVGGRFASHWGEEFPVSEALKDSPNRPKEEKIPFAILTPDGEWLERGRMGWFASVSNEKEDWPEIATKVLEKYKDYNVTVLDVHI
jgi:hypothetical protein